MNSEKRKLLEAYCGMAVLAIEHARLVEGTEKCTINPGN